MAIRLQFINCKPSASGKTSLWDVANLSGYILGGIRYAPTWRRYVFDPKGGTMYDAGCLREIADFCEARTNDHKAGFGAT